MKGNNVRKIRECRIVDYKFLYTLIILFIYIIGREIPLMGVDFGYYTGLAVNTDNIFLQTISGDANRCSVLALGISPYMMAGIIVQVVVACKRADAKTKVSPKLQNRWKLGLTVVFAFFMAASRVKELVFRVDESQILVCQWVSVVEMIAGAMIILWLADRNKQYGIGGQSALIFINIIDGLTTNIFQHRLSELGLPIFIGIVAMMCMVVMENSEKRIPVQRISIHNVYADKSYIAIKLNPIGVMPAMFSTAFFMIPQMGSKFLAGLFPENGTLQYIAEQMVVTKKLGVVVYIVILYALTVFFSIIFLSPRDMTEGLLKGGDCIPGLHAGAETKKYLSGSIIRLGVLSATVMSICLGLPMLLQLLGILEGTLVMLPSSIMMLTGITCSLRDEIKSLRNLDEYKPFI